MSFNADKCEVLRISNKRKNIIGASPYSIHGTALRTADEAKYLGVTLHRNLSWKSHIHSMCKKATAHSAFSDATWGDALLTSRNRHIRPMFSPSWNTLLQYGTPTPRTSSPRLKWSSDVQPDLWRPIIEARVVSPRCYKAFSGRLYRNDAHTARSSCCTGSSMDLSPSPPAPLSCTPH